MFRLLKVLREKDDADRVKVVRCKHCIWHSNRTGMCGVWFKTSSQNGYCYKGEKRNEVQNNHLR